MTAAPAEVPRALLEQLGEGGRLVVPVGGEDVQELRVIDHTAEGLVEQVYDQVRFVPLMSGVAPGT